MRGGRVPLCAQATALAAHPCLPYLVAGLRDDRVIVLAPAPDAPEDPAEDPAPEDAGAGGAGGAGLLHLLFLHL